MAEADDLQRVLLGAQNPDGGWGYESGSSWTEPTALALLALASTHGSACTTTGACERGCLWLTRNQRSDGGWPPKPSVQVSTWVTSLAILALSDSQAAAAQCRHGIQWLLDQLKPAPGLIERLVFALRGVPVPVPVGGGSPWFPGTAPWVAPTTTSIFALSDFARKQNQSSIRAHIDQARKYLLSRRCRDGGWNHGGSSYRSENANSYPETTGMALLALYGEPASELHVALQLARNFLRCPGSIEALSWLQMALTRHGIDALSVNTNLPCRTSRDVSLRLLALTALSGGNKFMLQV